MSADNYYVIRKHPAGGFAAVMGFASDEADTDEVDPAQESFPTVHAAAVWASGEYSEYGVSTHPELGDEPGRAELLAAVAGVLDDALETDYGPEDGEGYTYLRHDTAERIVNLLVGRPR